MKDDDWVNAIERKKNDLCKHKKTRTSLEKGIFMEWCEACGKIIQEVGYDGKIRFDLE